MKMNMIGAKKKAIDELMSYLDQKDGEELGDSLKPKDGMGVEVMKVDKLGDDEDGSAGEESPGMDMGSEDPSKPKMSDEELEELIQAIQSKIGG